MNSASESTVSRPRATGWLRARVRVGSSYPLIAVQAIHAPLTEHPSERAEHEDAVEVARYAVALAEVLVGAGADLYLLEVSAELRDRDPLSAGPSSVVLHVAGELGGLDEAEFSARANAVLAERRASGVWRGYEQAHVGLGRLPTANPSAAEEPAIRPAATERPGSSRPPLTPRWPHLAPRLPHLRRPRLDVRLPQARLRLPQPRVRLRRPSVRLPRPGVRLPRSSAGVRVPRPRVHLQAPRLHLHVAWPRQHVPAPLLRVGGLALVLAVAVLGVWALMPLVTGDQPETAGVRAVAPPPQAAPATLAPAVSVIEPTALAPQPTGEPTAAASIEPTVQPTAGPTLQPTPLPTVQPTPLPTVQPTPVPTLQPTAAPPVAPTTLTTAAAPPAVPTSVPTLQPPAAAPTGAPTQAALQPARQLVPWPAASPPAWPNNETSTAWLAADGYHLAARRSGQFVAVQVAPEPLRDVTVVATFQKTGGPPGGGYGIIVRDQGPAPRDGLDQGGRFYVFEVGDRGQVGIWRREQNQWVDLLAWSPSPAVQPGNASNQLLVSARGDSLTLSVNGTQAANVSDATLGAGSLGVFLGGDQNEAVLTRLTVLSAD